VYKRQTGNTASRTATRLPALRISSESSMRQWKASTFIVRGIRRNANASSGASAWKSNRARLQQPGTSIRERLYACKSQGFVQEARIPSFPIPACHNACGPGNSHFKGDPNWRDILPRWTMCACPLLPCRPAPPATGNGQEWIYRPLQFVPGRGWSRWKRSA